MRGNRWTALALSALVLAGCAAGVPGSAPGAPGPASGAPSDFSSSAEEDASSGQPAVSAPHVRVDWSRLEEDGPVPQADVDGGRWFEDRTDHLVTGEPYGPLVPYIGGQASAFNRWEREGKTEEYWYPWATSFFGLMTREGTLVTDPVYQSASSYSYVWGGESRALPVLLLSRTDPAWKDFGSGQRYAVAAEDGSWCTEFAFLNYTNREDRLFLLRPEGCTVLDSKTGARRDWSWAELGIRQEELSDVLEFVQWVAGLNWLDQGVCLGRQDTQAEFEDTPLRMFDPDTGAVSWADYRQWEQWQSAYYDRRWPGREELAQENGQTAVILDGLSYPLADAPEGCLLSACQGDLAVLGSGEGGNFLYRLSTGERLLEGDHIDLAADTVRPGRILPICCAQGIWTVYSEALEPLLVFHGVQGDWLYFTLRDGLLSVRDDAAFFGCYDLSAEKYIFFRNLGLGD